MKEPALPGRVIVVTAGKCRDERLSLRRLKSILGGNGGFKWFCSYVVQCFPQLPPTVLKMEIQRRAPPLRTAPSSPPKLILESSLLK